MAQTPTILVHGVVLVVSAGSGASHTQHYTIPKASEIAVSFIEKKRAESNQILQKSLNGNDSPAQVPALVDYSGRGATTEIR